MQASGKAVSKSRILAALDAEFDVFGNVKQALAKPVNGGSVRRPTASRQYHTKASPTRPSQYDPKSVFMRGGKTVITPDYEGKDTDMYPAYRYQDYGTKPTVVYVQSVEEADDLIPCLKQPLGFDMEWRVWWKRRPGPGGKTILIERPTAVVQLADPSIVLVLQISAMKRFPDSLKKVLESPTIWKSGVNIRNDAVKLYRDYGIECRLMAELGAMAHHADPSFRDKYKRSIVSLQKMVGTYLLKNILKPPVRTSNWELPLTKEQIEYAANDAHAALMVFRQLRELAVDKKIIDDLDDKEGPYTIDIYLEHKKELEKRATTSAETQADATDPALAVKQAKIAFEQDRNRRAYKMWYEGDLTLNEISTSFNLGSADAIRYILAALDADPSLPYSFEKLSGLVAQNTRARTYYTEWHKRKTDKLQRPAVE